MKRTKSLERYFYALDYEKKIRSKLTKKQFLVYTYLLSISKWDAQTKEEHYYVYKNSFTIKEAVERLQISQPTWRTAIKKLKDEDFIMEEKDWYIIKLPTTYAPLNVKLISFLLEFSVALNNGGNLVGVYATLYRYWDYSRNNGTKCCISINQLLKLFEVRHDTQNGRYYEIIMGIFSTQGLMTIKMNNKKYKGVPYIEYEILNVRTQLSTRLEELGYGPDEVKSVVEALENSIE